MIIDFTKEQQKQIMAGDRTIAALRLYELLRNKAGFETTPSIEGCEEIIDLLIAGVEQLGPCPS